MKKMTAYVRTSAQTQEVEQREVPVPEIASNEVLVKVQAFGVGIHDSYYIPSNANFPYVIGTEGAGIIEHVGSDVAGHDSGDRVMLSSAMQAQGGSWGQYVAVPADALVALPAVMSFTDAAAIPIAGKTALECMRALDLGAGETLFIAGASGAVGTLVIQLAAARGIRVVASASAANQNYMRDLGAEKTVDYRDPQWPDQIRQWAPGGVAAALAIQPDTLGDSMAVTRDGGHAVTVSGDPIEPQRGIRASQLQHHDDMRPAMARLVADIAAGLIRLVIEKVYPFDQALDALRKTQTRHARGKRVVSVDHD